MPEPGSQPKLKELEERWQYDRSPRVFLPLADELRKEGRLDEAIAILVAGLEHHADSVSGQVALGRCRLEAGDAAGAATALERALERDPTQLVANKLLAEARLRLGDAAGARERLAVCRLLADRDPDLDAMEARLAALAAPRAVQPIFALDAPAALADVRLEPRAVKRPASEPFGTLYDAAAAGRRIAARLASEGIFAVVPANLPAPIAPPAPAEPDTPLFFPRQAIGEAVEREAAEPTWSIAPAPVEAAPAEPAASVTLAALYFEQGHLGEAESEYRRVLATRPDDVVALAGLAQIAQRRSATATPPVPVVAAPAPVEPAAATRRPPLAGGLTQRKVARLRGLLERLERQREAARRVS